MSAVSLKSHSTYYLFYHLSVNTFFLRQPLCVYTYERTMTSCHAVMSERLCAGSLLRNTFLYRRDKVNRTEWTRTFCTTYRCMPVCLDAHSGFWFFCKLVSCPKSLFALLQLSVNGLIITSGLHMY